MKQARHKALDLDIKSDSAMVEQAMRQWLTPSQTSTQPVNSAGQYQWMLDQILQSDNENAKSAVLQNIEVFYSYINARKKV